ncbi:MAG: PilT/PilU family type 4a pilus ATPase [Aquisalimonadaceae bacterium]
MDFEEFLKILASRDGSDLYLTVNAPAAAKFQGQLKAIDREPLTPDRIRAIACTIMDEEQQAAFEKKPEMNLALSRPGVGRFRVNIFKQRNNLAMVIRNIKAEVPSAQDLNLPKALTDVIMTKRGLIIVVGATGSGKSTTLAAMIDHRNSNSSGHIITIEDPIEFVHRHKKCLVNQREVGTDTDSYHDALKNTLRQAPDVILIGEIRDMETMEHALAFAETGHLCLSTLHANNANQAIDRILNFFPEERHKQILSDLSLNLRGMISQRLIPTVDDKRAAAIEILLGSPTVEERIKRGDISGLKEVMQKSAPAGMQTFDMALIKLYRAGKITLDEAMKNADSANNLRLQVTLGEAAGKDGDEEQPGLTLSLERTAEEEAEDEDTPSGNSM